MTGGSGRHDLLLPRRREGQEKRMVVRVWPCVWRLARVCDARPRSLVMTHVSPVNLG